MQMSRTCRGGKHGLRVWAKIHTLYGGHGCSVSYLYATVVGAFAWGWISGLVGFRGDSLNIFRAVLTLIL